MKKKIEIEDIIKLIGVNDNYNFYNFRFIHQIRENIRGINVGIDPIPMQDRNIFIKHLKKNIILREYGDFGNALLSIKSICPKYRCCVGCPYERGNSECDENGNTCPFIISSTNAEEKFKTLIKTIINGRYEKKEADVKAQNIREAILEGYFCSEPSHIGHDELIDRWFIESPTGERTYIEPTHIPFHIPDSIVVTLTNDVHYSSSYSGTAASTETNYTTL